MSSRVPRWKLVVCCAIHDHQVEAGFVIWWTFPDPNVAGCAEEICKFIYRVLGFKPREEKLLHMSPFRQHYLKPYFIGMLVCYSHPEKSLLVAFGVHHNVLEAWTNTELSPVMGALGVALVFRSKRRDEIFRLPRSHML